MSEIYIVVKYSGKFGFMKPAEAVRDEMTWSQRFLTPSTIIGMERMIFPELLKEVTKPHKIVGHRISYDDLSLQQEVILAKGWDTGEKSTKNLYKKNSGVLERGLLINPILHLAFTNLDDAKKAFGKHICLSRNEDILYPKEIIETTKEEFNTDKNKFTGYELVFEENDAAVPVGVNRYTKELMYGWLRVMI